MEPSGLGEAPVATGRTTVPLNVWSRVFARVCPLFWSAILAAVVIGPMASGGWVVLLDWVTGPRSDFRHRIFDGSALPAGPIFFGLAAALHEVAGAAAGWLVPAIILVLAGLGGARLAAIVTESSNVSTQLVGATAALWNPFVHERLYAGQVAVLLGYALLPWLFAASIRVVRELRRGEIDPLTPNQLVPIALWGLMVASSVHFAMIGGIVVTASAAVGLVAQRDAVSTILRWWAITIGTTAVLSLAWIAPIGNDAPPKGNGQTIEAFATQPDPSFGLVGGTLVQRGFWRIAPGRPGTEKGWWWAPATGVLGGAALLGLLAVRAPSRSVRPGKTRRRTDRVGSQRIATRRLPSAALGATLVAGIVGWLLGQGPNGLAGGLVRSFNAQPGPLGVMREPGKFLCLVSMAWIAGLAGFAELLRWRIRKTRVTAAALVGFALSPVVLSPGLVWGVDGRLRAVHYPKGWQAAQAIIDGEPTGRVVVLPFIGYADAGFTNGRITRNTAKAYFGSRAELSDDAGVAGLQASKRTRDVADALKGTSSDALARLNIRFVVVPAGQSARVLQSLRVRSQRREMTLYVVD